MPLFKHRQAVLAKIETTYGVDSAPAAATDGVNIVSVDLEPLNLIEEERELIRHHYGNFESLTAAKMGKITLEVEAAGTGLITPIPALDALLRCAGHSRTLVSGTSVTYSPLSATFESVSIWAYLDGVLHKFTGCYANATLTVKRNKRPLWKFELMGLYVAVADGALVTPVLTAWQRPVVVNPASVSLQNFLGAAAGVRLEEFTFNVGADLLFMNRINDTERFLYQARKASGSFTIEAPLMAVKNPYAEVLGNTLSSVGLTIGTVVGQRMAFTSAVAQPGNLKMSTEDSILMLSGDLRFVPSAAGNEYSIAYT